MGGEEQRSWPRFRVKGGAYASFPEGSGALRDLSLGGAFIEDAEPLPEGSEVFCDIHVGTECVSIRGVVRRSVPQVGMGIEFMSLTPDKEQHLRISLRQGVKA